MIRDGVRIALGFSVLLLAGTRTNGREQNCSEQALRVPCDVEIGTPKIWPYSRVYPLLDGLFQDVAAVQVNKLSLDPNAANGTNLNALQQVIQVQAQYSALAGLQNGLAAQQASTASASAVFQTQLLQRESQLTMAQLTAQDQVRKAQQGVDILPEDSPDKPAARQTLTLAQDNLQSITQQLADVKAQIVTTSQSPNFNTTPPTVPPSGPTLPTTLGPPGGSSFAPNLPATKQMDNQLALLWERLARLVTTLNGPGNEKDQLYLVEFDTGMIPHNRKNRVLNTRYSVSCTVATEDKKDKNEKVQQNKNVQPGANVQPFIVDMYPRESAVNIMDEKYRETRFGLGALLQFFSVGVNATYNRDHLQISQMLGQSSYITGYGVGRREFGWIYGITLGDDSVSPGTRSVFALVNAPGGCSKFTVDLAAVEWTKSPSLQPSSSASGNGDRPPSSGNKATLLEQNNSANNQNSDANKQKQGANTQPGGWVDSVRYTPRQYPKDDSTKPQTKPNADNVSTYAQNVFNMYPSGTGGSGSSANAPQSAGPAPVSITFKLGDARIDPEASVNVDGMFLKRARDNFGRATPSGGGSGGILEATALDVNTWMPVKEDTLVLNLDANSFPNHFPDILLISPNETIDMTNQVLCGKAEVKIAGRVWKCPPGNDNSPFILPPLAYGKTSSRKISVVIIDKDKKQEALALISIPEDSGSGGESEAQSAGVVPKLQVMSSGDPDLWGPTATAFIADGQYKTRLDCHTWGPRLVCELPCFNKDTIIDVVDTGHAGGGIFGQTKVSNAKATPVLWEQRDPEWHADTDGGFWLFTVLLANITEKTPAALLLDPDDPSSKITGDVSLDKAEGDDGPVARYDVTFKIPLSSLKFVKKVSKLEVGTDEHKQQISFLNLYWQMSPTLYSIDADDKLLKGSNLIFRKLVVGSDASKPIALNCLPDQTLCVVSGYPKTAEGYLNFLTPDKQLIPVVTYINKTITWAYHLRKPQEQTAKPSSTQSQTAKQPSTPSQPKLQIPAGPQFMFQNPAPPNQPALQKPPIISIQ